MSYDIIAFAVSCLLILTYYLYLGRRTRRIPDSCVHAHNARIREQWVDMVMNSGKMDILAIQTIRNSVIAANFMASTAVLLIIGTLNISEKIGQWALARHPLGIDGATSGVLWQIKLGLLLLVFAIAFHFFSMAIRYFNHVGYMINLPGDTSKDRRPYHQTCAYLNKAGSYYRFGTRAFFFGLPIIMWFFGPYFLVLATLGLTGGLAILDWTPS
ncbi:DUF599 domain-containing protein [Methyloglobulus sp.]|uniref:DUF599 domain-containing protein n=1 Tax=Methyloglobulus sp. TaxID=2518622 RepID=UPI003989F9AD